jgi:hypothetical protein
MLDIGGDSTMLISETFHWWALLCAISLLNLLAWSGSAVFFWRQKNGLSPQVWRLIRLQLILSAGYVLGCAYRSAFPVFDIQRLVLVDSWLSSVMVGRSVATVAEVCFAAQWATLLQHLARTHNHPVAAKHAQLIVPMIVVAEICSWHAVLTTSNLGHVMEETIWGLCVLLLIAHVWRLAKNSQAQLQRIFYAGSAIGAAYVVYMFTEDVPMYWTRWLSDQASGRTYHSLEAGMADAASRWVVSHRWEDWQSEMVWMTLYFSVAVWLSIARVHTLALHTRSRQASHALA